MYDDGDFLARTANRSSLVNVFQIVDATKCSLGAPH